MIVFVFPINPMSIRSVGVFFGRGEGKEEERKENKKRRREFSSSHLLSRLFSLLIGLIL
jgi:hypothetical protein